MDYNKHMHRAYLQAQYSHDPSTQNGAVLLDSFGIVSFGVNNFPSGVEESSDRWERPKKYSFIEHAERTAIFNVARMGYCTTGTTLVCPWAACADCARAIVVSGVARLVRVSSGDNTHARWDESVAWGDEIMREGGVEIIEIDYEHPEGEVPIKLRRNGEILVIK